MDIKKITDDLIHNYGSLGKERYWTPAKERPLSALKDDVVRYSMSSEQEASNVLLVQSCKRADRNVCHSAGMESVMVAIY